MRSIIKIIALLMFFSVSTALGAVEQTPSTVVVMFGDSITVGFNSMCQAQFERQCGSGLGEENFGWSGLFLNNILEDSRRPTIVLNFGEGGTPSGPSLEEGLDAMGRDGVSRVLNNLAAVNASHSDKARYILIFYGSNDFGWGITPSDTRIYIRTIIDRAVQSGFVPIVGNLLPRSNNNGIQSYNGQIQAAAAERGARFVDQYSNFVNKGGFALLETEFSQASQQHVQVHPTNAGYQVVAQHWFDTFLAGLIEELPPIPVMAPILLLLDDSEGN